MTEEELEKLYRSGVRTPEHLDAYIEHFFVIEGESITAEAAFTQSLLDIIYQDHGEFWDDDTYKDRIIEEVSELWQKAILEDEFAVEPAMLKGVVEKAALNAFPNNMDGTI